jgi:hypothetical protein
MCHTADGTDAEIHNPKVVNVCSNVASCFIQLCMRSCDTSVGAVTRLGTVGMWNRVSIVGTPAVRHAGCAARPGSYLLYSVRRRRKGGGGTNLTIH